MDTRELLQGGFRYAMSLTHDRQQAEDLLMGAPSEVRPEQLRDLHIRLNLPE